MATGVSFTHTAEAAIQNRVFRNNAGSPTFPATLYLALFTASPGEAGSIVSEITVGGYSRQAITFGAPASQTTGSLISSTGLMNFGTPASTNGETAAFLGLIDSSSGAGTVWAYGALDSNVVITSGTPLIAAISGITHLLD